MGREGSMTDVTFSSRTMNLLLVPRVRRKRKSFWSIFSCPYYESEKISFKEKVYTFLYCMNKSGYTTQGEGRWSLRMMDIDRELWRFTEEEFKKDYSEFLIK